MAHLILHCGGPKTGSSALQNTLTLNADKLREAGLYYPQVRNPVEVASAPIMGNAFELAMAASKSNRATAPGVPEEQFTKDAHSLLSMIMHASENETVILSTEWFSNLNEKNWDWVINFLRQTGRKISTVTYFRPQVEQISSALGQFVKNGARPGLETCVQYFSAERYLSTMAYYDLQRKLPLEAAVVAIYNRSALCQNDITMDFFDYIEQITGIYTPNVKTSSEINPSFNGDALTLMYSINSISPSTAENALILEIFMRIPSFRQVASRPQLILSEANAKKAKAIFAPDNARAVRMFGESFRYLSRESESNVEYIDIGQATSQEARGLFWDMWHSVAVEASEDRKALMAKLLPRIINSLAQAPSAAKVGASETGEISVYGPRSISDANISNKAIVGKNGFLFLGGPDSNNIANYLSGAEKISLGAVNIHRHNFNALESTGIPYSVLVVPEAHVIYRDLLPDDMSVVDKRPINTLQHIFGEKIIYPVSELLRLRYDGMPVYTGRDSHYTEFAAIECYKKVRFAHGLSSEFELLYTPSADREAADLLTGDIVESIKRTRKLQSKSKATHFAHMYCNDIINNGRIAIYTNAQACGGRVLCFGTSFSEHLIPAYTTDFREVIFCYGTTVDEALVRLVEPERIFVEMPERFLHFPNMALAGSVLCGHVTRADIKPQEPYTSDTSTSSIGALSALFSELADPSRAAPVSLGALIGPAALARVRYVRGFERTGKEHDVIRGLFAGQYRSDASVKTLADLVDSGPLADHYDIFPETEMGGIVKMRGLCRAGRYSEATQVLERHIAMFGPTYESIYFTDYLVGKV